MTTNVRARLNRRDFLRIVGSLSIGGLAAACAPVVRAPAAPAAVEPAKPAAAEPTSAPPAAETVTLTFGRHDPAEGDAENVKVFQEKFPNIKVEQQMIGSFAEKVPALTAAGTLPDVFRSWEAMCLDLARAGQIVPLDTMVAGEKDFKPEDFYENWWNWPVLDGKRYGVPDAIAPHLTFYNVDLFDKKGVEYPNKDKFTWDDFEAKAKKITDVPNKIFGSETLPVGWTYYHLKNVWQNGGDFFSPDYKKCVIDSPETIEAIQYWTDLLLSGKVMPSPSQIVDVGGAGAVAELMSAGKIGMQRMGSWLTNDLVNAKIKFNIVPEPSKKRRDTITHGAFNTIPKTTKNVDAAWKWLNFRCSPEGIYNYAKTGKFPGARKSTNLMTPHPWVVDVPFKVDWDMVPQSLDYGHVLPGPANEGESLKIIGDALQKIFAGDAKAKDLFPEIAPKVTEIMNRTV